MAVAVGAAILRAGIVPSFELAPDEAYYLTWASGAGPDHPPLVSWMAKLAWALHGAGLSIELAARALPIVIACASSILLARVAISLGGTSRSALVAAVASTLLLLPASGAILFTPDAPLGLALTAGMLAATLEGRAFMLLLAAAAVVAPLAKVNGYLLLPSAFVARRALGKNAPLWTWGAAAIAALATLPLTWTSLRFQIVHAFSSSGPAAGLAAPPPFPLAGLPIFLLGQIALFSPALVLLDRPRTPGMRFSLRFALVPLGPVLASALVRVPEPNWAATSYPGAIVFVALASDRAVEKQLRVALAAAASIAFAVHLHVVAPFLPIGHAKDPTARLHGWRDWACGVAPNPARGTPSWGLDAEKRVYRLTACPDRIDQKLPLPPFMHPMQPGADGFMLHERGQYWTVLKT